MFGITRSFGAGRRLGLAALSLASTVFVLASSPAAVARPGGDSQLAGMITTVAGGVGGPGPARSVPVYFPCDIAAGNGALYANETFYSDVRKISMRTGAVTTAAGNGLQGDPPDGSAAAGNGMPLSCGVALDHAGNLLLSEAGLSVWQPSRIRVVAAAPGTFYGQRMTAGDTYTIWSGSLALGGMAVDPAGNILVATGSNQVYALAEMTGEYYGHPMRTGHLYLIAGNGAAGYRGDGGPAGRAELNFGNTGTAGVLSETVIRVDRRGNLLIPDTLNHRVRVVPASTGTFYGRAMRAGDIYTMAGDGRDGTAGNGYPAVRAQLTDPSGLGVDGAGNVIIEESAFRSGCEFRVIAARTGRFYGTPMSRGDIYALSLHPASCDALSIDTSGNLVFGTATFDLAALARTSGRYYGQVMTAGHVYIIAGDGRQYPAAEPATRVRLDPTSLARDAAGNLLVDEENAVQVLASSSGTFYGQRMTAGDIYNIAGTATYTGAYPGNGIPATRALLSAGNYGSLALDHAGNLILTDTDNRVRVVASKTGTSYGQPMRAGYIYTIAGTGAAGFNGDGGPASTARLNQPAGLAIDDTGNIVLCDEYNSRIRVIAARSGTFYGQPMRAGHIYTIAGTGIAAFKGDGGPARSADLNYPEAVNIDQAGNLVFSDTQNFRIRVIAEQTGTYYGQQMTSGHIYTIAGDGSYFASPPSPKPALQVGLIPGPFAFDHAGNIIVGDSDFRLRLIAVQSGTFYGQPMQAGYIYTLSGNGTPGFSGDGGPASKAQLAYPTGITVDSSGDIYFADYIRIRKITA